MFSAILWLASFKITLSRNLLFIVLNFRDENTFFSDQTIVHIIYENEIVVRE